MKRGVQSAMRILMVVVIAFLVGGMAMAKEKKTAPLEKQVKKGANENAQPQN